MRTTQHQNIAACTSPKDPCGKRKNKKVLQTCPLYANELASIMEEMLKKMSPRVAVKLCCHFLKNDKLSPRDVMKPSERNYLPCQISRHSAMPNARWMVCAQCWRWRNEKSSQQRPKGKPNANPIAIYIQTPMSDHTNTSDAAAPLKRSEST